MIIFFLIIFFVTILFLLKVSHERQVQAELTRVRDALLAGDVVDEAFLKSYHQHRSQNQTPVALPGVGAKKKTDGSNIPAKFQANQEEKTTGETATERASNFVAKVSDWFG